MKILLLFLITVSFNVILFGQTRYENKLIKYLKLFPLDDWSVHLDSITSKTRDSLITEALKNREFSLSIDTINNIAEFFDYGRFVLYNAKDGKDIIVHCLDAGRWEIVTDFWQYNPSKNTLKDVTPFFTNKSPSFKSFFKSNFSFEGKDTNNIDFRIQIYPEKDSLSCELAWDAMDTDLWLNKINPYYQWVAVWNRTSFIWRRQKDTRFNK